MLNCQRILFPIDFSERCLGAAPFVRAMAGSLKSEVTLLHVISLPPAWAEAGIPFSVPESGMYTPPIDVEGLRADRNRLLHEVAKKEFSGLPLVERVEAGDPAMNVVEFTERERPGLVMMPTRGHGRFRRFLLGSVTAKVLHDVKCPVWTDAHTPTAARDGSHAIRNILCAVEIEDQSVHILQWAADFAAAIGAKLTIAHVVTAPEAYSSEDETPFRKFLIDAASAEIDKLMLTAGVHGKMWIEGGKIASRIRDAAGIFKADLVIIGRGCLPNPLGRLRTHAYSIISESPSAVISV